MKISNTRKEIINFISDYMDKTLSEGCLIICTYEVNNGNDSMSNIIMFRDGNIFEEIINGCYHWDILGHYDITAVLKYIIKNRKEDDVDISIGIEYIEMDAYDSEGSILIQIPNKTLHLYTDEEDKQLLDLLLKLK